MSTRFEREEEAFAAAAEQRAVDLDTLAPALRTALARRLGTSDVTVTDLRIPAGAGTSSATVLFRASWVAEGVQHQRDLVLRTHPDRFQLFREPDFHAQYRVIDALHRGGHVRVPEALFYEDDPGYLGVPFFVMSQLRGRVPVSSPPYNAAGFLYDATPAQRRRAWESAIEELCRIARVPVDDVWFLDRPELGATGLEQQLEYWRRSIDWSTAGETPDFVWEMLEWLEAHLPEDRPDGFAWGDARIGNMMFDDDFRLVGVMDWEQANLGGIRQDLAWWLFFDTFHGEGRGLRRLDGLGTREETIAWWEDRVGQRAGDLTWFEVFAGFKVGLLSIRTLLLMGAPDARALDGNLGFVLAREILGW